MFKCRLWLHIGPPSTLETQNSRIDSNQDSTGWLSLLRERTVPIVLLSTHAAQIMHTVFIFQIIRQNMVNDGFRYPVLPDIILQLARWSSFKTAATRAMFLFVFVVPGLPPWSVSSINSKLAMPSKYRSTQYGRVTKHFYEHFPHFCSRKSRFATKFYRGTLFKIFFHSNL